MFLFEIRGIIRIFAMTMRNEYHRDIISILLEKGSDGCMARDIARQIYNRHYGLFATELVYHDIQRQVRLYLWRQSRLPGTPFMHLSWGVYAIKPDFAVQLDFLDELLGKYDEEEKTKVAKAAEPSHAGVQLMLPF